MCRQVRGKSSNGKLSDTSERLPSKRVRGVPIGSGSTEGLLNHPS